MDEKTISPLTSELAISSLEEELRNDAASYFEAARSKNTNKAYASDWMTFCRWCSEHKRRSLPATAQTVALYLTYRARSKKISTIGRCLSAIAARHLEARFPNPIEDAAVKRIWSGIKREKGIAQLNRSPALTKDIRQMVKILGHDKAGARDRAILLLGFAGGMRRSELVGLDLSDIELSEEGIVLTIRRSKTDQLGRGRKIGIPYGKNELTCPVKAVTAWLDVGGIKSGALFRSIDQHGHVSEIRLGDRSVALIVKRTLRLAGVDARNFAGHSLRAGFATAAATEGASERDIQKQTGHKSLLVLRRYIRDGELFRDNAASKLGL